MCLALAPYMQAQASQMATLPEVNDPSSMCTLFNSFLILLAWYQVEGSAGFGATNYIFLSSILVLNSLFQLFSSEIYKLHFIEECGVLEFEVSAFIIRKVE